MNELEEVYAAFDEEREKRVATDKVLQVYIKELYSKLTY